MKKYFMLLLAGVILLAFTACQNDELVNGGGSQVAVSFKVQMPEGDAPATRTGAAARGDGSQVNRCIMEVYLGGKLYGERQVVDVTNKSAAFNVKLVTSQTYDFVFWADKSGEAGTSADNHYKTTDGLQKVAYIGSYSGNDESYDAFTGKVLNKVVTGAFAENVTLTRPFGQLNIKATDIAAIGSTSLVPAKASLSFGKVYQSFNALTGDAIGELASLGYAAPADVVDAEGHLTVDYLFAPQTDQLLADIILTMYDDSNQKITQKELNSIPVQRNYKTNVTGSMVTVSGVYTATLTPEFTSDISKEVKEVASVSEVADALKTCDNVVVKTAPTQDATIALPKYTATDKAVSITLPETTNHTVTINYASSTDTSNPPKELTIIAPQTKKLVIDAEETTVYLNGTKYDEIVAGTAENTLVINDGVTVSKLTVKAGNVKVFGKGTITTIEKSTENSGITYIYASNQAQLPATLPQGFEKVSLEAENLKEAMAKGGVYQLKEDADITGRSIEIPADMTATLDLNGNTITAANRAIDGITVCGNLTLKDSKGKGRIVANKDWAGGAYGAGLIRIMGENAAMIMQGGTIYAARENAANNGQFGVAVYEGGDFTITGGKIEAGWSAVLGNGNNKTQNSVIRIEGGELISTSDYAVYLPQSGTTTISGGKVYGVGGGVCINRGTLNVEGTALITSKGTGDTGDWGDGTGNMKSAAINVAAKYGDCVVDIKGGTLTAEANALVSTGTDGYTPAINVSGGTFSDPSLLGYLSAGANVKVKLLKDYEGPGLGIFYGKNGSRATVEIDLNQHAWNLTNDPLFGSTGYQNQYFHLEKDAFVTFRNGTVQPKEVTSGRMLIQNYCHLTLDNVKLIGGSSCKYVISNNNGSCTISNSTVTAATGQCAFDVYSYKPYPGGVTVTVNGQSVINGRVEFDGNSGKKNGNLVINGGTINGDLSANNDYYDSINKNIIIKEGVTFGADVTGWDDYK
jgi:hypothetical protein